ncbi:MAG: recombinase family protein [Firmicutes bacterium]|nr:recombinase family protein [Bacillota bacterium]
MARIKKQPTGTNMAHISKAAKAQILWRIAVYIRLSKEDKNKESGRSDDSDSVVNQQKILTEYLEKFFVGEYVVVDFYIDDGLTGTDDTRKDFLRMLTDIEDGKVNCVICKTLSRAFRNYSDQGYYLEEYFPQMNVRFISTGDPKVDTYTNPEAITSLEVPINGLMNDRFAAKTSSDVRRTFDTKRRNGEFIGAFPPYGYLKDPEDKNHLILDPDIMPIKRDIYSWLVHDGMSMSGIAKKLNELGIPNPSTYKRSKGWNYQNPHGMTNDGLWVGCTIRRIMLEPVNLGHMVQGRQRVVSYKVHDMVKVPEEDWFICENTHEPTFTQEQYDTLARLLQRDTRTPNDSRTVHLFGGFLKCRDCGKAMRRKPSQNNVYYVCRTYNEKGRCTRHSIREDELTSAVLAAVQAQVSLLESLREIIDQINLSPTANTQSQRIAKLLKEKSRELEKVKQLSDGLYVDWKSGDITREDYQRMKARFEAQKEQLGTAIVNLEEEQRLMGQGVDSGCEIFEAFLKYKNVRQIDRTMLIELIDTVHVHEGREFTIDFLFTDELERILEFVEINSQGEMAA